MGPLGPARADAAVGAAVLTTRGLPAQLAALRKELADARAETKRELDHIQTALGDVLRDLDAISRCTRIVLKLARHVHGILSRRK